MKGPLKVDNLIISEVYRYKMWLVTISKTNIGGWSLGSEGSC